jgi:hypothetical protein
VIVLPGIGSKGDILWLCRCKDFDGIAAFGQEGELWLELFQSGDLSVWPEALVV